MPRSEPEKKDEGVGRTDRMELFGLAKKALYEGASEEGGAMIAKLLTAYMRALGGGASSNRNTVRAYRHGIASFIAHLRAERRTATSFSAEDIESFERRLKERKLKDVTVRARLAAVRFFCDALRWAGVPVSGTSGVDDRLAPGPRSHIVELCREAPDAYRSADAGGLLLWLAGISEDQGNADVSYRGGAAPGDRAENGGVDTEFSEKVRLAKLALDLGYWVAKSRLDFLRVSSAGVGWTSEGVTPQGVLRAWVAAPRRPGHVRDTLRFPKGTSSTADATQDSREARTESTGAREVGAEACAHDGPPRARVAGPQTDAGPQAEESALRHRPGQHPAVLDAHRRFRATVTGENGPRRPPVDSDSVLAMVVRALGEEDPQRPVDTVRVEVPAGD